MPILQMKRDQNNVFVWEPFQKVQIQQVQSEFGSPSAVKLAVSQLA